MFFHSAHCADGFSASLAVGVDFITNVLLAAGNPLHSGISGKGVLKGDLLVSGCGLAFLVPFGAAGAKILAALHTTHGRVSFLADIALDHSVDVSLVGLG